MAAMQNTEIFQVGDIVYAGRPPLFSFDKHKKQNRATIMKVLPAARRVPLRYLVSFDLPDAITKETQSVVIPHKRRDRVIVFPAAENKTSEVPVSPKQLDLESRIVQDRMLCNDEFVNPDIVLGIPTSRRVYVPAHEDTDTSSTDGTPPASVTKQSRNMSYQTSKTQ